MAREAFGHLAGAAADHGPAVGPGDAVQFVEERSVVFFLVPPVVEHGSQIRQDAHPHLQGKAQSSVPSHGQRNHSIEVGPKQLGTEARTTCPHAAYNPSEYGRSGARSGRPLVASVGCRAGWLVSYLPPFGAGPLGYAAGSSIGKTMPAEVHIPNAADGSL